ncbi:hypothetical protein V8V91_23835 [Algoriphagus halophilus]|uniref:hypothetical protein n=1 Tax=Algoriphagus halophilus TaxID=226505 RepID=UPI00358F9E76
MKEENPGQFVEVDSTYLASLPVGTNIGPEPKEFKPWAEMDYGNFLINTYELAGLDAAPRERSSGKAPSPMKIWSIQISHTKALLSDWIKALEEWRQEKPG